MWHLDVNLAKTNILHVRPVGTEQSKYIFLFNKRPVYYCEHYKYLGVKLSCHLNIDFATESHVESAGRALSAIVCKMIKAGGFPYKIYTRLVPACVNSIVEYGSEVLGYSENDEQNKLLCRAARAFLGVPKNAPLPGIIAEIGWLLPHYNKRLNMIRYFD